MSADQLVQQATNALFVLIALATLVWALRNRRRPNGDAALFFGAVALVVAAGQVAQAFGFADSDIYRVVSGSIVMSLPYLLLRLVEDFTVVPRPITLFAVVGLLLAVAGFAAVDQPYPTWFALSLVGYFAFLGIYAGWKFVRGARSTTGAVSSRMVAAAIGSLLLGVTVLVAGLAVVLPVPVVLTRIGALGSALAYVAAFAPPAFLIRAWQEPQLRAYLRAVSAIPPRTALIDLTATLERAIAAAVGAAQCVVGVWDPASEELRFVLQGESTSVHPGEDLSARTFLEQRPAFSLDIRRDAPKLAGLRTARGARAVITAPLTARERRIGVLAAFVANVPIFIDDELKRIQVLADQAALSMDAAQVYAELASANHELSEATRVKTQFLANMSHELRTPLNAILGFSELLEEQIGPTLEPRQQRFISNIRESGIHLLELVNEVLDLSKVEAGRVELRPETMPLASLVEPTLAATKAAADARGVVFETDLPGERNVHLDPSRVRQILYNLLSNAVKFTASGGSVRLRMLFEGTALHLEVADSGIGIPPDRHDRVFGTFERLHEGVSDAPGTGLGLALTKRLVELQRGAISFESTPHVGTTFRVTLPDASGERVVGDRLLIVDDERSDADLIAAVASEVGLRSEIVSSGATAVDLARRDPPRAIVLDLRLPDERGELVLETLKADPAMRDIPVIVVSVEDDEGRSRVLGADDHLTKPIDRRRLLRWLRRIASSPRVRDAAAAR